MTHSIRTALLAVTTASLMAAPALAAPQDAALIKKGQQIYTAQKCQQCHSVAGKGSKKSPLDGVGTKLSVDEIRKWITHPVEMAAQTKSTKKPEMKDKYSKLPPADIDALVAFMQSLK